MVFARNILLYPLAVLYGLITGLRNFLFDTGVFHSESFRIPVICVGNITVGGTGKTPHTEYLLDLLGKNFRIAVLSRGYKRKTRDFRIATRQSTVDEIGDEPYQVSRKFPDTLVAVDRNRADGIRRILETDPGIDAILLDDGLQHRSVSPGLSILLSDYERPYFRDHMLPYGNLREYRSNMRRADIILITKCPKNLNPIQRRLIVKEVGKAAYQNLYFTSLAYRAPKPVFENDIPETIAPDLRKSSGCGIVMVTGIANPKPLRDYLGKFFGEITEISFPDHHSFEENDISAISDAFSNLRSSSKYILTTEKDAVRLREFSDIAEPVKSALYYVPVDIHFLNEDKEEFDNLIIKYVRKNKRYNSIP